VGDVRAMSARSETGIPLLVGCGSDQEAPVGRILAFVVGQATRDARHDCAHSLPDHRVQRRGKRKTPSIQPGGLGDEMAGITSSFTLQHPEDGRGILLRRRNRHNPTRVPITKVRERRRGSTASLGIRKQRDETRLLGGYDESTNDLNFFVHDINPVGPRNCHGPVPCG